MATSSVAARSLALAVVGFGAAAAFAQAQNVTAFNPYNGVGLPGARQAVPGTVAPAFIDPPQPIAGGPAFNPWRPATVAAVPVSIAPGAMPAPPSGYTEYRRFDSGLPPPPPGPIRSRVVAVPQRGDTSKGRASAPPPTPPVTTHASVPPPAPPEPPKPVPIQQAAPAPTTPAPAAPAQAAPHQAAPQQATTVQAPAPKPAPAPAAAAPPRPAATAAAAPPPPAPTPEPVKQPPARSAPIASIPFSSQSAEISLIARGELDRLAKTLASSKHVELRAYAGGPNPADARKVALARALAVRSYLIDQGVKARIEVGAYTASGNDGPSERVDVVAPNG